MIAALLLPFARRLVDGCTPLHIIEAPTAGSGKGVAREARRSVVSAWTGHSSIELTVKRNGRWAAEAREQWSWAALRSRTVDVLSKVRMAPAGS